MAITFQSQVPGFRLSQRQILRKWIGLLIMAEKKIPGDVNFVFTSDDALHEVNIQYLHHDTFTDIITFDSSHGVTIAGDIMISVDRVRDNAKKFNVDFETELYRVMAHGVLHLCGYKDKTAAQKTEMRKKEDAALRKFKTVKSG